MTSQVPVIDGWFTIGAEPALLGNRCPDCGTYQFPPTGSWCPNPTCSGSELQVVPMSRQGKVWSYTDARYKPPAPYVATTDPYEPFAIAAVELEAEGIVILGQVADGYGVADLTVGMPVEVVVEALETTETDGGPVEKLVWRWKPLDDATRRDS